MTYRQLTADEIIQLGQELADVRRWEGARDYVSALYGLGAREPHDLSPHQVTVLVETETTWQASRTQYHDVVSVLVADVERHLLPYDLSRYWWAQFTLSEEIAARLTQDATGKLEVARTQEDETLYLALKDLCAERLGVEFSLYDKPHDPITYTYLIDTPPAVSFAAVYVAEGENTR